MSATQVAPKPLAIALGFVAVYLVWGSTYLAMRIGVRTMPPFMLGSARFFIAGLLIWAWYAAKGKTHLARPHWRNTAGSGVLLLVFGNGGVVWSLQHIPSGLAALIVGTVPLWIVAIEWVRGVRKPSPRVIAGVVAGLLGIAVLLGPDVLASWQATSARAEDQAHAIGVLVVLCASLAWAMGSLLSRGTRLPEAPLLPISMQMLSGGAALLTLSLATGEWSRFAWVQVSAEALMAIAYLIVGGSLVAYSAYIWLLQVLPPARVATYAFVNPVVAVFLGSALAGEPLTSRTLLAAAIIVGAVALITLVPSTAKPAKLPEPGGGKFA